MCIHPLSTETNSFLELDVAVASCCCPFPGAALDETGGGGGGLIGIRGAGRVLNRLAILPESSNLITTHQNSCHLLDSSFIVENLSSGVTQISIKGRNWRSDSAPKFHSSWSKAAQNASELATQRSYISQTNCRTWNLTARSKFCRQNRHTDVKTDFLSSPRSRTSDVCVTSAKELRSARPIKVSHSGMRIAWQCAPVASCSRQFETSVLTQLKRWVVFCNFIP